MQKLELTIVLLVLAGTAEEDEALAPLGTAPEGLSLACSRSLREGGSTNWDAVFRSLRTLLAGEVVVPPEGARVRHAKFGDGRVLEVEGEGARAVVTVQFTVGVKRLALGYAPLETVGT